MVSLKIQFLWSVSFFVSTSTYCCLITQSNNDTLRTVHILFRHGDRTKDGKMSYPLDPHINETYEPYGFGQLTNKGKLKMYMVGKELRERYDGFLGPQYRQLDVEAISTDMTRTKMSLLLVLASLFPPQNTKFEWSTDLNWQPITYNYVPLELDYVLTLSLIMCRKYTTLLDEYVHSSSSAGIRRKFKGIYRFLIKHTGKNITSILDFLKLYFDLTTQFEFGLKLPDWTESIFPKYLESIAADHYLLLTATSALKRLSGGFLLRKIIKDMGNYIKGKSARKMFLYSGHEINIAFFLGAMEVFFPHIPRYGAYVGVELHEKNHIYCIKITYQDYSGLDPKVLRIPGCVHCCPFNHFVRLMSKNIPRKDETCE